MGGGGGEGGDVGVCSAVQYRCMCLVCVYVWPGPVCGGEGGGTCHVRGKQGECVVYIVWCVHLSVCIHDTRWSQ